MTYYPVKFNGKETNLEVTRCGKIRRVRKIWCESLKIGDIDLSKLKPTYNGYYQISCNIHGKGVRTVLAHQLVASVFLDYQFGSRLVIDHIDCNKSNNNVDNLRVITHRENVCKEIALAKTLPIGVYFCNTRNLYRSQIQLDGKKIHLGFYIDPMEAGEAYQLALNNYYARIN